MLILHMDTLLYFLAKLVFLQILYVLYILPNLSCWTFLGALMGHYLHDGSGIKGLQRWEGHGAPNGSWNDGEVGSQANDHDTV